MNKPLSQYESELTARFPTEAQATVHLRGLEAKLGKEDSIAAFTSVKRSAPTLDWIIERAAGHEMLLAENADETFVEPQKAVAPTAPAKVAMPPAAELKTNPLVVGSCALTGINKAIAARAAELEARK